MDKFFSVILFSLTASLVSCTAKETLFTLLPANHTNIFFENKIEDTDSLNILDYLYFYNGGGVAIGDINNDGLPDIYFSSNRQSNKLYLNKGNFHFEDITDSAGVAGKGNWKTGVTMADVNGDGFLDIYVCEVGKYKNLRGRNELFVNNGDNSFAERGKEYGLDAEGFNTQASFFDYDKDGDLDMFLVNHSVHSTETYVDSSERRVKNNVSGDKLYRCDKRANQVFFTEVTQQAGIYSSIIGYGLNVITGDFNNDNWDDIYVSNDFHENDYYYVNNRDGTFTEMNQQAFGHESRFSMGSDAGDINNDGWLDIITVDMLPRDEKVLKSSAGDDPLDIYDFKTGKGYHHQYSKNCLQLNAGGGMKFSDISFYAGVSSTDWSWSPLLADFDNDGIKDLFVSNGIIKRPNDLDFLKFVSGGPVSTELQKGKAADKIALQHMPGGKLSNYFFKGTSQLKFTDQSTSWGLNEEFFSNGAAWADFDNDGDLDLAVNHINAPAGIYRNNSDLQLKNHYLTVLLKSPAFNRFGFGSKVVAKTKEGLQFNYLTATRGFESSSAPVIHFGLGAIDIIDTLQVLWPDGVLQTLTGVKAGQQLTINYVSADSQNRKLLPDSNSALPLFKDVSGRLPVNYRHVENNFVDFNVQRLIPHEISTQGPKLAVADVNEDGLDDFFVCGAKGQPGKLFQQTKQGSFSSTNEGLLAGDAICEDVNAVFFDADNDRDEDLYVVSGGNEAFGNDPALLDRLYINDGKGNFKKGTLPLLYENKSVAVAADIDHDGDIDLFIGGRVTAGSYGSAARSSILINDGRGTFSIAPENVAAGLQHVGMVTDAVWSDIDKDGWKDLIVVGEWMPITIFKNRKGKLQNETGKYAMSNTTGLWNTITAGDLDKDGFEDLLVGNRGLNSKLQASEEFPLRLYTGDIDGNGRADQLLCIAKGNAYYPFLGKEELERVIPGIIKKKYLGYEAMAGKTIEDIFGNKLEGLEKLSAKNLASLLVKNTGGKLTVSELPEAVQWSPVFSFITGDFDRNGNTDIIAAGNFYGVLPYEGRYDAGYGNVLLNSGNSFETQNSTSGLWLEGEVRDIKKIRTVNNDSLLVFSRNNNTLLFYRN